jgi:antitoxin component YwqK of YwqJK toxin-antitoxin module
MLIVGCSKTIDVDKLVERGGLYYEINSDKPFSGETVEYYENGQKSGEETYKDGNLRKETWWFENGQKGSELTFKDGEVISAQYY